MERFFFSKGDIMVDLREVETKSGKRLVFCNFEELLKEAYNAKNMEEVEPHVNGQGEYEIHCPFCKKEGHTKHKLYIKDDLTVGHCFVCTRAFINVNDIVKPELDAPDFISNLYYTVPKFQVPEMKDPDWSLDKFKYEFDDFDETGYNYLLGRHEYFKDLYKILGFKFWNGNVVMPFMHNGEPFYYQIRFSSGSSKIRYFLPPISKKAAYIIERNIEEDSRHRILIVEGIFDAVAALIQAPEYTPVAVLGSSISNYQISQIRDYAGYISEIRIWMDETKISNGIKNSVKQVIDYCPISIIQSDGPDPEEILKDRMKKGKRIQWIKSKYKKDV